MATERSATEPDQNEKSGQNTNPEKTETPRKQDTLPQTSSEPKQEQTEQKQQPQHNQNQGQRRYRNRDRSWNYNRERDVLYEKAVKLAQSRRVEFLDNGVYNVIGDHGTYTVTLDYTGKLSCNCLGFIQKGKCSHAMAVSLVTKNRHRH